MAAVSWNGQVLVAVGPGGTILKRPAEGAWEWVASPEPRDLHCVIHTNGLFVASGDAGVIISSPDGVDWTGRDTGSTDALKHLQFLNGRWLALGQAGAIVTSSDGTNWQAQVSGATVALSGAAYGDGLYQVVGQAGTILSSSDASHWTRRTTGVTNDLGVAAYGSGSFVAIGSDVILNSTNGIDWQVQSVPAGRQLNDLAFGQGAFVTVGAAIIPPSALGARTEYIGYVLVSTNGAHWDDVLMSVPWFLPPPALVAVVHGANRFVASAGVEQSSRGLLTSKDGRSWALAVSQPVLGSVKYENGLFLGLTSYTSAWQAVIFDTYLSADGANWTAATSRTWANLHEVIYGGGIFVAVGAGLNLISPGGRQWISREASTNLEPHGMVFGNGVFVGLSPSGSILTSGDGLTWNIVSLGTTNSFVQALWANGRFVFAGKAGAVATSSDGVQWTLSATPTQRNLNGIAFGAGQYLAVGGGGTVLISTNGLAWTAPPSEQSNDLLSVAFGNGVFVVATASSGPEGVVLTSTDGLKWEVHKYPSLPIWNVRFLQDLFVAESTYISVPEHMVLSSKDGITWDAPNTLFHIGPTYLNSIARAEGDTIALTPAGRGYDPRQTPFPCRVRIMDAQGQSPTSASAGNLAAVAYGAGTFVIVGDGAAILQSELVVTPTPTITAQPIDQTANAGTEVTFSVTAVGSSPLSYQWQYNGMRITGATNATLRLNNVTTNQVGAYGVAVSDLLGTTNSREATLTLNLSPAVRQVPQVRVSVLAGSGVLGYADGPGASAQFNGPNGAAVDTKGNLYVADVANNRIRKVAPNGAVTTVAGSGLSGYVDGLAPQARFNLPIGVAVDGMGNIFVADAGNNRIRTISSEGVVSTVAGNGLALGVDGPAASAGFIFPNDLVLDAEGALYVSEFNGHSVRKIAGGMVSTVAGNGTPGYVDGLGPDARFNQPGGITRDGAGNLYVTEFGNQRIRRISPEGLVSTVAGNGETGYRDGPALQAQFNWPDAIAADDSGNLFVSEGGNHTVRIITAEGQVYTLAGNGSAGFADGTNAVTRFSDPTGLGRDAEGNLYVTDSNNNLVRKIAFLIPPWITAQPNDQSTTIGTSASFLVVAGGVGPFTYQWQHNGTNLATQTNASLEISAIGRAHAGGYSVVVSNPWGSTNSRSATLNLTPVLKIAVLEAGIVVVMVQDQGNLSWRIEATSDLVTWQDLGKVIFQSGIAPLLDNQAAGRRWRLYRAISP